MAKKFLLLFFTLSFLFISCSKKSDDTIKDIVYPITGFWVGTYTVDNLNQPPLYFAFSIQSDSTIIVQSQGEDGKTYYQYGTWSLSGTSFSASATTIDPEYLNSGVAETSTATFDNKGKLTSGIWKTIYHTGKFSLERKN
jgi:hypothetical protein